jgi:adenosylcobinamide-GDP ribazoletransferase
VRLRRLRLATQFLTRVPVCAVEDFSADELSRSAAWFPFVGFAIGVAVTLIMWSVAHRDVLLSAPVGLVAWVCITGALHLDGLADLSDALAAAHRDAQKFLTVLADPHLGTFGVVSIVLLLISKLIGLFELYEPSEHPAHGLLPGPVLLAFPLIPAWARLGPLAWSRWLKPLKPGQGAQFASQLRIGWIVFWSFVLLAASAALAPVLCVAPLVIAGWGLWLKWRLGGTTGDCTGAGVEITEVVLLYALVLLRPSDTGLSLL